MDGEIDLELYTVSIIRLNNIFQKVENNEDIAEINNDLAKCINDFYKNHKENKNCKNKQKSNYRIRK